ncbi:hypothetical protein TD95_003162 [Thielaviopsis punctulata]|uniref:AB hydrolase-1 domain-containing protein n=1 Tax=Thielaviopsis punctulata TaxID=72032 RepID=A0A0F4Z8X1_9PEZI|nr:hypothetical protein TD95_003162 [Thielaviopsis punctulata]
MLPEPTLSFTLQSLHDNTSLDCRIYHPVSLEPSSNVPAWCRHSAIFAHPYAPLGGSYNDHIVQAATEVLLSQGYLVGTFNFRGASGSVGRTSWTAKPERSDYMSMVGFIIYYIHYLDPYHNKEKLILGRHNSAFKGVHNNKPTLILGGYSYGSMITCQLPPLSEILSLFESPPSGSPVAEIRTRAKHLAMNQNAILSSILESQSASRSPRHSLGMRVGGSETAVDRKSHESSRSLSINAEEIIRKGFNEVKTKLSPKRTSCGAFHKTIMTSEPPSPTSPVSPRTPKPLKSPKSPTLKIPKMIDAKLIDAVPDLIQPRVAYLLISPLQGLVTNLATMSLSPFSLSGRRSSNPPSPTDISENAEAKLWRHPTLAVFGDNDMFVPIAKLRAWKTKLSSMPDSKFVGQEISGASHFWVERGSMHIMKMLIREFSASLIPGS